MTPVAVDTNVLARLATGDSPNEHATAVHLLATYAVFVPISVTLELEWVLRSRYRYSAEQFTAFTRWLMQQAGVEFGESKAVHGALNLHEAGFDFTEALHLLHGGGRPLASFERALVRRALGKRLPVHALVAKVP